MFTLLSRTGQAEVGVFVSRTCSTWRAKYFSRCYAV